MTRTRDAADGSIGTVTVPTLSAYSSQRWKLAGAIQRSTLANSSGTANSKRRLERVG